MKHAFLAMLAVASISSAQRPPAPRSGMVVAPEWLAGKLGDPSLVLLHVGSTRDYEAGHIPGARLVTLADISITGERGLRLELPPVPALREAFGKLGIGDNSRVVIYPGTDSMQSATRVWFTLDYLGMGDRAALLDGGLKLWRAEGRPVSTEPSPSPVPGKLTIAPRPELVVDAAWLRDHLRDASVAVLDARTPQFYSGEDAGAMLRAGRIPGARNVPFNSLFDDRGRWKPAGALRESLGKPDGLKVSYCHIGLQATVLYFAARYLGMDARLYDGSFQDWSSRPELPVEAGK